ncbi:hypothetical protein FOZ61_004912 [Perkinsus olseni]|uniref:RRM domain-containing protein n=1 Tax=Perkinsus olseni TaxID=32597 RepID=A0A7J6LJZ4_PEROL|nr:hypothetical protein FOZ61_004912 [Perkinsus olseni]
MSAAAVESDGGKRRKVTCGGAFLRLPLEVLSAKFRSDRKDIERDLLLIHNFISSGKVTAAENPAETVEKLLKKLDIVEGRVSEKKREQASLADTIKRRVTVMENIAAGSDADDLADWGDPDTLLLMEWLVRNGFSRTLKKLMETPHKDSLIGQGGLARESFDPDVAVDEKIRGIKRALRDGSDEGRFERAVEYIRKAAEDGDIAGPSLGVACRAVSCGIRGAHEHGVGDDTAAFWCIQGRSSSDARLEAASNLLDDYTRFVYHNDDISSAAVSDNGSMLERLVRKGMEHPTRLRSHLVCPYTGRIMEQALASPAGHVLSSHCMSLLSKGNGGSSSRSDEHDIFNMNGMAVDLQCASAKKLFARYARRMKNNESLPEICPTISSDSSSEIMRKEFNNFAIRHNDWIPIALDGTVAAWWWTVRQIRMVGSEDDETPTDDSSHLDGNEKQFTTRVLDAAGFRGSYDFLYVPLNFKTHEVVGFAFVNFGDQEHAQKMIDGFNDLVLDGCLPLVVEAAKNQGLQAQIDHLRESPVNAAVEEFRPKLFELGTGRQLEFPRPTNPRPPRRSHRHRRRVREYVPQKPKPVEVCDPYAQTHLDYSMALGDLLL